MKNIFWDYEGEKYAFRDKHATISVITFKKDKLSAQDDYVKEVEQTFSIVWLKRLSSCFAQEKVISKKRSKKGSRLQLRNFADEPVYSKHRSDERPLLCHTEFWKQRGGETSYSELQERFYTEISKRYGAERGESHSRLKYTTPEQAKRFCRYNGDDDDVLPPIKGIWV